MKNLSGMFILMMIALVGFTESLSATQTDSLGTATLIYGNTYNIQNGWNKNAGGYLDVKGEGCQDNFKCVSTSKQSNRARNSGAWTILSADGSKKAGEAVSSGDMVMLQNLNNGDGGYLGTRGYGKDFKNPGFLCVSTYKAKDAAGSTTWKIEGPATDAGHLKLNGAFTLQGQWNNAGGGYLDTRGYAKDYGDTKDALLCVSTSQEKNRAENSGRWKFVDAGYKNTLPLVANTNLKVDKKYFAADKSFYLIYQADGNLCVYNAANTFIWGSYQASGKFGKGSSKFQKNGSLVVKDEAGNVVWESNSKSPNSILDITGGGKLQVISPNKDVLFESK